MTFLEAKETQATLNAQVDRTSAILRAFPHTGAFGLVPDHVRATPEYKIAKTEFDTAFAKLRAFNSRFVKAFAKELREERRNRRPA